MSILNSLKYFHVCHKYSFDLIRNLLENVAQYEIKLLCGYLNRHFILEQDLLFRIYALGNGFLEQKKKNHPTKIIP